MSFCFAFPPFTWLVFYALYCFIICLTVSFNDRYIGGCLTCFFCYRLSHFRMLNHGSTLQITSNFGLSCAPLFLSLSFIYAQLWPLVPKKATFYGPVYFTFERFIFHIPVSRESVFVMLRREVKTPKTTLQKQVFSTMI